MYAFEGCTEITTYEHINLEAMRLKATSCLYMWYLIRLQDKQGKGYILYTDFLAFLKYMGLDRNVLYNAIDNPCSPIFFRITQTPKHKLIEYNGVTNVSRQLNVKPGDAIHLLFPLVKTLQDFNAYVYAGLFANITRKSVMFSREKIEELTGLSKPTQIAYEKIAKIEVEPNMASINIPMNMQRNQQLVNEFVQTLPCANNFYSISNGNVFFQLPNSYRCTNVRIYKGKRHRANKLVKPTPVEGMDFIPRRASSTCLFYKDIKQGVVFTDEKDSYIRTNDRTNTSYGKKAKLFRYNFMSPTRDYTVAVPNYHLDKHKVIRYFVPSNRITEEVI